jgi:hypothetical protein
MTTNIFAFFALFFIFLCANAQPIAVSCNSAAKTFGDLVLSSCSNTDNVLILKYQQNTKTSPYATEFDSRSIFMASSDDENALFRRIGLRKTQRGLLLVSTQLAKVPEPDQINHRKVVKTQTNRGAWIVFFEEMQYASQGQAPGYAMECGTAIRRIATLPNISAVSECFAYENKQRFLQILTEIPRSTRAESFPAPDAIKQPQ